MEDIYIAQCRHAEYAYSRYLDKLKQIDDLTFECDLLVEKYHSEMRNAHIPFQFDESFLASLFDKNEETTKFARENFLNLCFSEDFLTKFKVEFLRQVFHGWEKSAIDIILGIGDYEYTVEIPFPRNIVKPDEKKRLMGQLKFKVYKLHRSKKDDLVRELESVLSPTYDWKKCFVAIEADVAKMDMCKTLEATHAI